LRYGVIEIARALKPDAARVDLVHRIDRDTSGCLLLSKDAATLRELHTTLRAGDLDKRYVALMRGRLPDTLTSIDCALEIERSAHGERRARGRIEGKPALTHVAARHDCGPHTLAEFQLVTGRMHQIRAHAQHIGHPLAGDLMYGDAVFNRELRARGLRRLFLHANRLAFRCRGHTIDIELPLPPELEAIVQVLNAAP
jgi:23S rRNA pseudouridine955/2504/2580 synthase